MSEGKDAPTVNPGILIVPEVSEVICINVTIIDHNLHLSPKVTITIKIPNPWSTWLLLQKLPGTIVTQWINFVIASCVCVCIAGAV